MQKPNQTQTEAVTGEKVLKKGLEPIRTREEAVRYCSAKLERLRSVRDACNVEVPGNRTATVQMQQRSFRRYMMSLGAALEAPSILHATGLLDDAQFSEFYEAAFASMLPSVGKVTL